ncbi:MAG: hypothetical protein ACI8PZ_005594 [Myxococcota bacterium]|jgi:hypothetical protein
MSRALSLSFLLLTGCLGGPKGELWLFQISTIEAERTETIDENFIDANVPDEEPPDESWSIDPQFTLSDRLVLGTVLRGKAGARTLILDGAIYPGTEEKGVTTFTWEGSNDSQVDQQHDAGYRFLTTTLSSSTVTITLEKDSEIKGLSGSLESKSTSQNGWTEDDEWSFEAVGLPGGQIPAFLYLDGPGVANDPTQEDCTGVTCNLTVSETVVGSATVQATYMGKTDNSGYGNMEDASMPYGDDGGVDPGTTWTTDYSY